MIKKAQVMFYVKNNILRFCSEVIQRRDFRSEEDKVIRRRRIKKRKVNQVLQEVIRRFCKNCTLIGLVFGIPS